MDLKAQQKLPVQLARVYFQHAVDKILFSREPGDTQSKALKCIGLYALIARMAVDQPEITYASLAERIGTTYQGILNPLEYLKRIELVTAQHHKVPGTAINVQHLMVEQSMILSARREIKRITGLSPGEDLTENGLTVPAPWHDVVKRLIDTRRDSDTPAKVLKAIGLMPIMARVAADGLPVTRPVLAKRLGVAENTLTPLVGYLEQQELITVEERRIKGHIGSEFAIHLPAAIVDRTRRALRRLEKEAEASDWQDCLRYRQKAREMCKKLTDSYGHRCKGE